jgi:rhodanese-related sulfurtransferase
LAPNLTPQELAGMLFDSLHQKLLPLGDDVEVWPAHGAGSLCGKAMRAEKQSTIGKEKDLNYALKPKTKAEFVELLTSDLPERPGYFAADAEMNRAGAASVADLPPLPELTPKEVAARQRSGAVVLDTRSAQDFGASHVPGSIHIALSGQFASWAGILLGLEKDIIIVAEDADQAAETRLRLARVGIEHVAGVLGGGMASWAASKRSVAQTGQITAPELSGMMDRVQVVDVRRKSEWDGGHIPGAILMPLNKLTELAKEIDADRPVAVHCKGGYRSAIAASLLQRAGLDQVMDLKGGFDAWRACGLAEATA